MGRNRRPCCEEQLYSLDSTNKQKWGIEVQNGDGGDWVKRNEERIFASLFLFKTKGLKIWDNLGKKK